VHYAGKSAETAWEVENYYRLSDQLLTLVRLKPKTGRTHQIRVHLSHLGHPLFADERYLGQKRAIADKQLLGRHFLHAAKIRLDHPKSGERLEFEAPLPEDLSETLSLLKAEN
jgi:23S rRNA-/tRNA-specific pseudouridylate synthase